VAAPTREHVPGVRKGRHPAAADQARVPAVAVVGVVAHEDAVVFDEVHLRLALARKAGKVWREHGALDYKECVADDVKVGKWTSFPRSVKLKRGETVFFSYIVYKSRAHRDKVNKQIMSDPRMKKMMENGAMPFEVKRMVYGGFKVLVDL